ncbi:hypothetical protein D3C87_1392160 [compost metagenome]
MQFFVVHLEACNVNWWNKQVFSKPIWQKADHSFNAAKIHPAILILIRRTIVELIVQQTIGSGV